MKLTLLDGFELALRGKVLPIPLSAQRLVAFLGLHERPLQRGYVAGSLYTDKSEERACANIRSALWRLRQTGVELIAGGATHLQLAHGIEVDVRAANARARRLVAPGGRLEDDDLNPGELDGDLLPDWYDDWVLIERERLRQLRLHALEALCHRLTAMGDFAQAVDVGLVATSVEPLRESAHRALIAAHLAEGNRGEAVRQYDQYARTLREELGFEPSPLLMDLIRSGGITAGDAVGTVR